jgi:hypothetical protein
MSFARLFTNPFLCNQKEFRPSLSLSLYEPSTIITFVFKMPISKHFVLLFVTALCLASADAASQPKRFLRAENEIQDKIPRRGLKKSKASGSISADELTLIIPPTPTAAPVKLLPDLDDWIFECGKSSGDIDQCVVNLSFFSNPLNCKTCLKALAMTSNPPPAIPMPNGVKVCAEIGMCGQCSKEDIVDFYACGLLVDQAYVPPVPTAPVDPVAPVLPPVTPTPPLAETVVEDTINCPAVWPGTNTDCVMIAGYNRKKCIYYEYSADSICTCGVGDPNPEALKWTCVNGPVALVVEEDKPMPIIGIDAEISSLP